MLIVWFTASRENLINIALSRNPFAEFRKARSTALLSDARKEILRRTKA